MKSADWEGRLNDYGHEMDIRNSDSEKRDMNKSLFDEHRYAADSSEAVLQCAVAVACVDGEFASDERI